MDERNDQPAARVSDRAQQRVNEQLFKRLGEMRGRLVGLGATAPPTGGATVDAEARAAIVELIDAFGGL